MRQVRINIVSHPAADIYNMYNAAVMVARSFILYHPTLTCHVYMIYMADIRLGREQKGAFYMFYHVLYPVFMHEPLSLVCYDILHAHSA